MRVGIYGLGNVLRGDDAVGPYVVEVLRATYDVPDEVTLADLGTPGLDLVPYVAGYDALVLVDTVETRGRPGDVRTFRRRDILAQPPGPRLSPHDPGVKESLLLASVIGEGPSEVLLVGVIPENTSATIGLSRAAGQAVPIVVGAVVAEVRRLGLDMRVRERLQVPRLWWEEPVTAAP